MPHITTMNKKYIVVEYTYGIFKNLSLGEWLDSLDGTFPDYELFQVLENSYWTPAGFENSRKAILKYAKNPF